MRTSLAGARHVLARLSFRRRVQLTLMLGFGLVTLGQSALVGDVSLTALCGVGAAVALGWFLGLALVLEEPSAKLERLQDNFIATVSHELRTPLTSITGSLALLSAGLLDQQPERAQRMLRIAAANADRLARLVDDVLDVERLASGSAALRLASSSPVELAERAVALVQDRAMGSNVSLVVESEADGTLMAVSVDGERIVQALGNVLDNAVKFSPAGGSVVVHVEGSARDIRFEVRDQGEGIPVEQLSVIFDRFSRLDMSDARRTGGTGLGLAITKSIVEAHGGLVAAESGGLGQGTTVWFTLPRSTLLSQAA